jgi:hypothetical protein
MSQYQPKVVKGGSSDDLVRQINENLNMLYGILNSMKTTVTKIEIKIDHVNNVTGSQWDGIIPGSGGNLGLWSNDNGGTAKIWRKVGGVWVDSNTSLP